MALQSKAPSITGSGTFGGVGGDAWNVSTYIKKYDSNKAYCTLTGTQSDYITAQGFNFNIPSNATITGLQIYATLQSNADGDATVDDIMFKIDKNTYVNFTTNSEPFTAANTYTIIGSTDSVDITGGTVITPQMVNSDDFGVWLAAAKVNNTTLYIDSLYVKVYYQENITEDVENKSYEIKVYTNTGAYLTNWSDAIDDIEFTREINSAGSQLTINLARNAGDYGEGTDIDFNYKVKVYCLDHNDPNGRLIFQGYISGYTPVYKENKVTVTVLSDSEDLTKIILQDYVQLDADGFDNFAEKGNGTFMEYMPTASSSYTETTFTVAVGTTQIQRILLGINLQDGDLYPITFDLYRSGTIIATAQRVADTPNTLCDFVTPVDVTAGETLTIRATYDDETPYGTYSLWENSGTGSLGIAIYEPDGTTQITYNSQDPSAILRDIIDKYRDQSGSIDYDITSIDDTGTTVSYTFNTVSVYDAIQKCLELAPVNWYWYIDMQTNLIHFHEKATAPQHTFALEKHLADLKIEKRIEDITNTIIFTGGGDPAFYKKYTQADSIQAYGIKSMKYIDQRVTVEATADTIANSILEARAQPELRVELQVIDSNGQQDIGYDIENVQIGDVVAIRNVSQSVGLSSWDIARWDSEYWDYNIQNLSSIEMQIQRIQYRPDSITIFASTLQPDVNKRIEDINRNLEVSQTLNNPSVPTL